jgi:Family of unknown function (DUF5758)/Pentapeptide repeats (8 copies)
MKIKFLDGTEKEFTTLAGADLYGADLYGADLRGADLSGADLRGAYLRWADLYGADLYGADLRGADLRGANLSGANLFGADLRGANLERANLYRADLEGANLADAKLPHFQICPEKGFFRGFKKLANGSIAELEIAFSAKRTSSLVGRKCRASKVRVVSGEGASRHDSTFVYTKGAVLEVSDYDDDIRVECTRGIHFYITRAEAEAY